jgi:hypothetical protein
MRHVFRVLMRLLAAILGLSSAGCQPERPKVDVLPERVTFIALARDFADFRQFGQLDLGERPGQGETHKGGKFIAFVNSLPKPGSKDFPVGTIIVKENVSEDVPAKEAKKIFAMVKRGGGFNAEGAKGWEWFELNEGERGVAIHWRGVGAPNGESYGGDPMGSCNGCHEMAHKNDYVLSKALKLD